MAPRLGANAAPLRLELPSPPDPAARCDYAEGLASFCRFLLDELTHHAPRHAGESELLDRYADFLTDTPPGHTNPAGEEAHECIDTVFVAATKALRRFQRALPPAPPPPPVTVPQYLLPQQVSGLFYDEE
jgi:hypothetical protein